MKLLTTIIALFVLNIAWTQEESSCVLEQSVEITYRSIGGNGTATGAWREDHDCVIRSQTTRPGETTVNGSRV